MGGAGEAEPPLLPEGGPKGLAAMPQGSQTGDLSARRAGERAGARAHIQPPLAINDITYVCVFVNTKGNKGGWNTNKHT